MQRSLARPRFQRQLLSLWESECAKPTRKWCVPRTFPRNPAILRVWSRSTPWAPLRLMPENKRFFLLLLLGKDRNAARNVAIIGLEKTRQDEKKREKRTLKWNELLKYTSAYKSLNNYRCGQSRGVSFARLLFQLILSFFFFKRYAHGRCVRLSILQ